MTNMIIGMGKDDFYVCDVVYVIGLDYLFRIIMLRDWFKLFIKFGFGLEIVGKNREGIGLFSRYLIDVINLKGNG